MELCTDCFELDEVYIYKRILKESRNLTKCIHEKNL